MARLAQLKRNNTYESCTHCRLTCALSNFTNDAFRPMIFLHCGRASRGRNAIEILVTVLVCSERENCVSSNYLTCRRLRVIFVFRCLVFLLCGLFGCFCVVFSVWAGVFSCSFAVWARAWPPLKHQKHTHPPKQQQTTWRAGEGSCCFFFKAVWTGGVRVFISIIITIFFAVWAGRGKGVLFFSVWAGDASFFRCLGGPGRGRVFFLLLGRGACLFYCCL